jgi:hypothetical protein
MKLKFSWIPETDDAKGVKNELSNMHKMPPSGAGSINDGIKVLRFGIVFLFCFLLAGMGTVTFVLLRNAEIVMLKTHYQSSTSLIRVSGG